MKIVIDCVGWASEIRGVDRYYFELIKALLKVDRVNTYYVFVGSWQKYFVQLRAKDNLKIIPIRWSSLRILRNIWHAIVFPFYARAINPDVVHLPNTIPLIVRIAPTVCTIHDLLEYVCPETFGFVQARARKVIVRTEVKQADVIIAVSDLTRDSLVDILRVAHSKIKVIYSGVDRQVFNVSRQSRLSVRSDFKIGKKYILFVGILEKKKNIDGLIKAFNMIPEKLRQRYQLVIAGKADNAYEEAKSLVKRLRLEADVMFLGQVSEGLAGLYQGASLFVLPSFYEGFGLPVLEAMASGIPVVVSKHVAIGHRLRGCCAIIDPDNPAEIGETMRIMLTNKRLRERYVKEGIRRIKDFTWENAAAETLEIYGICARRLFKD
ncbi:MAG: glycosyltransferase family 4 protein [candidate division WOR-3 bacterium]|nr:glycosyltransferase family 4 protein [candidate division WOR-3 bacterium]